ncbi:hypothetical protein TI39_contig5817g00002 [Zymoseptoria brevis]|uniref:Uncharacterized protein n=1 Tax=Zymoseptoria brevis TaxID=1047168 RepID=A0A0F4G9F4_9PEZI|nr:hypothetical protein TI39_contig5817g00002 [Zymoseptoria brevis]
MDPPAYEEIARSSDKAEFSRWDTKNATHLSIREEVGASRSQHVAALVEKMLPQIRERAKHGLSRTTLLILPSDQANCSKRGQLVGYAHGEEPILIQLDGLYDGTQFWTQQEALELLRQQTLEAVSGNVPTIDVEKGPAFLDRPPAPQTKTSFWSRKQSTIRERVLPKQARPPVTVDVELDQANFRAENAFGLFETLRGRAVVLTIEVR